MNRAITESVETGKSVENFSDNAGKSDLTRSKFWLRLAPNDWLLPAEKSMALVAVAAGVIDILLIIYNNSLVDWPGYLTILALIISLLTIGFFYRTFCAAVNELQQLPFAQDCYFLFIVPVDVQLSIVAVVA